jgi:recombination protein RecT
MSNQLQTQAKRPSFSVAITTEKYKAMVNRSIRDPKEANRFIAAITSAVAVNPALQVCEPSTVLAGALLGNSLGLSPSPQLGQYYLVPFKNKAKYDRSGNLLKPETTDAQFVLGYKGYVQLALRSGYYKHLNVIAVKAGELIRFDPLTEEVEISLNPDELSRENSASIGYLATFEYMNGFRKTIYWSRDKMEAHALRYSKGYAAKKGYTFWEKDFDAMAFKTMLRQLISKWGIMSIDLQTAFEQDTVIESEDYVDAAEISLPSAMETDGAEEIADIPHDSTSDEDQVNLNDL